ncbi:hypothetical protein DXG01_015511, partial [Tephrocybe rancida]
VISGLFVLGCFHLDINLPGRRLHVYVPRVNAGFFMHALHARFDFVEGEDCMRGEDIEEDIFELHWTSNTLLSSEIVITMASIVLTQRSCWQKERSSTKGA